MPPTFVEICRSLNRQGVRYLVIGGHAVLLYGVPRQTLDVDLFIDPSLANCGRLLEALAEAGIGIARKIKPEKILQKTISSLMDLIRVDIFTEVPGLPAFEQCFSRKELVEVGNLRIPCLSLSDLLKSKKTTRSVDQRDMAALRKVRKHVKPRKV